MARTQNSMHYILNKKASKGLESNTTKTLYKRYCKKFSNWARKKGLKRVEEINEQIIQEYVNDLLSSPSDYSPSTIHTYIAPLCKATNINMKKIKKPKRTTATISKGRNKDMNPIGKAQETDLRFQRIVRLQRCIGIRRKELTRLEGRDLVKLQDGNYYIHVRRGKGGKEQFQMILPQNVKTVREIFENIDSNEKVFTFEETNNVINFHAFRRDYARDVYTYFQEKIHYSSNQELENIKEKLMAKWEQGHLKMKLKDPKNYSKKKNEFIWQMREDTYFLRGKNKSKALREGKPTEYNRLALLATSVEVLSHWRIDVTIANYII